MTWPGVTLTILAYLGMLVEALFIVFALIDGDWPALIATGVALAATIATIIVTPSSWRRFLPPARPKREHLEGLRQYLALAEAERLRVLQSPSGAELRATDAAVLATPAPPGRRPRRPAGAPATTAAPTTPSGPRPTRRSPGSTCTSGCCPTRCCSDSSASGSRSSSSSTPTSTARASTCSPTPST